MLFETTFGIPSKIRFGPKEFSWILFSNDLYWNFYKASKKIQMYLSDFFEWMCVGLLRELNSKKVHVENPSEEYLHKFFQNVFHNFL